MEVKLIVASGKNQGKEIPLPGQQFLIGRGEGCQLRPASERISRKHCAIIVSEGRVIVRDLGSTNGTSVNDERIAGDRELKNGDKLNVGGVLEFEIQFTVERGRQEKSPRSTAFKKPPRERSKRPLPTIWILRSGSTTPNKALKPTPLVDLNLKNTSTVDQNLADTTTILLPKEPKKQKEKKEKEGARKKEKEKEKPHRPRSWDNSIAAKNPPPKAVATRQKTCFASFSAGNVNPLSSETFKSINFGESSS